MKQLIKKYRTDKMTPADIEQTRERLQEMTDDRLGDAIYDDWHDFEPSPDEFDLDAEAKVFRRISVNTVNRRFSPAKAVLSAAAMIAAVLLLYCTIHLYTVNRDLSGMTFTASTDSGQRVSLTLPDNSSAELNSMSVLTYNAGDFNDSRRRVSFSGEAYFDIVKDRSVPFVIDTHGMTVTVKGTSFNLISIPDCETSTLFLFDGDVVITSDVSGVQTDIHPGEKAVINRASGKISVAPIGVNDNPTAWKDRRLSFVNASLNEVFDKLQANYGFTFSCADSLHSERFTGMIPLDDINAAHAIVSKSFRTEITVDRK